MYSILNFLMFYTKINENHNDLHFSYIFHKMNEIVKNFEYSYVFRKIHANIDTCFHYDSYAYPWKHNTIFLTYTFFFRLMQPVATAHHLICFLWFLFNVIL